MLQKAERLSRVDFATFFKKGKRIHGDHCTMVVSPSPTFHASVVVSKKVSKLAVNRNTLRRRVYAQLRTLKTQSKPGVYIVLLKPSFASLSRKEATAQVGQLIVKIVKSA